MFSPTKVFLSIVYLSWQINALSIDCNFSVVTWTLVGATYTCTGTINFDEDDCNVVEIRGNHTAGNSDSDVMAIALSNQQIGGIPRNLDQFFPNLTVLSISNAGIADVLNADLFPFPNLQALILFNNNLQSLNGDLFQNTPLLQYINLASNQITNFGPNLFHPLRDSLRVLRLTHNICIDAYVDNDSTSMASFLWQVAFLCPPSVPQIEREILNGENFQNIIFSLERRIDELENQTRFY